MPNKTGKLLSLIPYLAAVFAMPYIVDGHIYAADTTNPVTTYVQTPASPDGKNGWYVSSVQYQLNATDLGSGVQTINYRVDSNPWQTTTFEDTLNLAPNPSFEETTNVPVLFTKDWKTVLEDSSVTYSRDITTAPAGFEISSIKINSTGSGWHSINHSDNYAVTTPYANMNASLWIKTASVVQSAYFKVFVVTKDSVGNVGYTQVAQSASVTGTTDWTKVSATFVASDPNAVGVYIEPGLDGTGTAWFDAASVNQSITAVSVNLTIGADGNHTLEYYSTDRAGNAETHSCTSPTKNCVSIKIDQTPPGNWHDSGATRGLFGSDHEVYVYATVEDATSGISTFTDKYQYHTENNPGFGRFSNLLGCNSTWSSNGWATLITPPWLPGVHSAYIITPKTDLCNSNWKICKTIRFYSEDMAGNSATKDFCINGPWVRFRGEGIVRSNQNIDMLSEPSGDNTDGLMETGGDSVTFFTATKDWWIKNYGITSQQARNYDYYWSNAKGTKTQINTSGNLVSASGIYYVNGNFTLNNNIPNNYDSATFSQVVFINGDLTISKNINTSNSSAALFIVKGKVDIAKSVESINAGILADGDISTAYDRNEGDTMKALVLRGLFSTNRLRFQRTLQGTQNDTSPSEDFIYEPKILLKLSQYLGVNSIKWLPEN